MTLRDASDQVAAAIEFGQLAAQQAPPCHPIFAALADAVDAKTWIDGQIPWWSSGDSPPLPNVTARVNAVIAAIYSAAADLKVDPNQPLPVTTFPSVASMPWAWVGAGALAIALSFMAWRGR
jgi:hypothetical protein